MNLSSQTIKKAELEASLLLEKHNITEPYVDVFKIAHKEDFKLVYFSPNGNADLERVSGFYSKENGTIYINSKDIPARRSFTLAHELGHAILKHENPGVLLRSTVNGNDSPIEKEANYFAANLLIPEEFLIRKIRKHNLSANDIDILADLFAVSYSFMKYRMKTILK
jgi:Zn-dependent peptidase ImmA (M78 family)